MGNLTMILMLALVAMFFFDVRITGKNAVGSTAGRAITGRPLDPVTVNTPTAPSLPSTPGRFPQGSERLLVPQDLYGLSKTELRIMRNEIFARHGYIFKSPDLIQHFANQVWYAPQYVNVLPFLSAIEKQNIDFIRSFE